MRVFSKVMLLLWFAVGDYRLLVRCQEGHSVGRKLPVTEGSLWKPIGDMT